MNNEQGISNNEVKGTSFRNSLFNVHYSLFIGFIIFFSSCKKEPTPVLYMGYDYFPANLGHYVIYECDSVYYNQFKTGSHWDTLKYQVKEVIDSIYMDNEGRPTMRLARYIRFDTTIPWNNISIPVKLWYGNLLATNAQRVEDNFRYIKLIFPISLNATWNGNVYNTIGTWNYQYITVNTPFTIATNHFDSTLTVLQQKDSSFLQYQYYEETYATGIGLIYKKVIDYRDSSIISIPPPLSISTYTGTAHYTETYISSGN